MTYLHVFSPVVGLALNVLCQVCYCRYKTNASLLKSTFFGFLGGAVVMAAIEFLYSIQFLSGIWQILPNTVLSLISYTALGYCYFHFINLGETARRIRLLRELKKSKGGLSMDEILRVYNAKEIIENRLGRLLRSSQVIEKNNKYCIGKPTMLLMSKTILFLKLFILGKKSEFD